MPIPKSTRYDQLERKVTKKSLPFVENIEKEHIYCNEGFEENDSSGNDFQINNQTETNDSRSDVHQSIEKTSNVASVLHNANDPTDISFNQTFDDDGNQMPPDETNTEESISEESSEEPSDKSADSFNEETSKLDSSSSEDEMSQDSENEDLLNSPDKNMSEQELHALALASFIVRHNLTGSATDDLIKLIKALCPGMKTIENRTKQDIFGKTDQMNVRVVHYCQRCDTPFPDDKDIYRCTTDNCTGLRYKGGTQRQLRKSRKPRRSFVMGDIDSQLAKILERNGIWQSISRQKAKAKSFGKSHEKN